MENLKLEELSLQEKIDLYGGAPSPDTSFWYDVSYYVSYGVKKFFNATSGSTTMASPHGL